jgi:opacity protein-like surface antigen
MKQILFLGIMIFLFSVMAGAQDYPQTEIFGGFSLLKIGGKDFDNLLQAVTVDAPAGVSTSRFFKKSFDASIAHNFNPFAGVEVAAQYSTNNAMKFDGRVPQFSGDTVGIDTKASVKVEDLSVLAGPRFAYRNNEKVSPFVHLLVGVDYSKITPAFIVNGSDATDQFTYETGVGKMSSVGVGAIIGGGIDVNITDVIAVRPIQVDFAMARRSDYSSHSVRASFGIVFRFDMK